MSNLTSALRIGTSGMQIAQLSLATVSHNVVNANTAGFSRQIVQTSANSVEGFGNGVKLEVIQRITDRFLTERARLATSDSSYASQRRTYLDSIESALSSAGSGGGLDSVVGGFINAFSQLTNDPTNTALRRNVVQQAELVARTLNSANTSLQSTATNADLAINSEVTAANQVIRDIASLNGQIAALSVSGNGANVNDLMDQRDLKIAALAERFSISVSTNSTTGAVRITTENGRKLVDEASYSQLVRTTGSGTFQGIGVQNILVDGSLSPTVFPINTDTLTSGKIKALIDIRDDLIPDLTAQINEFTQTFKEQVNLIASRGSSFPPVNQLTSANTYDLTGVGANLYTELDAGLEGSTFNISVVDSQGDPVATTVGATAITLPSPGPFSLTDLAALINNDATIGNTALGGTLGVTATATTNSNGEPILTIQAANSNHRVVLSNGSGDVLGILGMNNLFTGSSANDIAVRADISANPDLIPTARMRSVDGGLSSQNNENALALSQLADSTIAFGAAGSLGAQTVTAVSYTGQILSNLAVTVADAKDRESFNDNIKVQLDQLVSGVSGVNINEELSQMLIYQNSFQASARIITVVNDLLAELVNIVGR